MGDVLSIVTTPGVKTVRCVRDKFKTSRLRTIHAIRAGFPVSTCVVGLFCKISFTEMN